MMALRYEIILMISILIIVVSNGLHEIGHIAACLLLKCRILSFKIIFVAFEAGKPCGNWRLTFHGHNHCAFTTNYKWKMIIAVLAGSIVDLALGILLITMYIFKGELWWASAFLIAGIGELFSIVYNLLPSTNGDGKILLKNRGGRG